MQRAGKCWSLQRNIINNCVYCTKGSSVNCNYLILTGRLHTYIDDLNEQARGRYRHLIHQMAEDEGVTEDMKRKAQ